MPGAGPTIIDSHPNEMEVIRHQRVDRAEQLFADGSMKHELAEGLMETGGKPPGPTSGDRVRPENRGATAIVFG